MQTGSAVAQHQAQGKAAKANKKAAAEAMDVDFKLLGLRQQQEEDATALTIMEADRQARSVDAVARVAAGEAGVTGASVDALLGDIERDRAAFSQGSKQNLQATLEQLQMEKVGAKRKADDRAAGIASPSPWLTGMRIGGAAADAASSFYGSLPSKR